MKNPPVQNAAIILVGALLCSAGNLWGQAVEQRLKSFGVNGDVGGNSQTPLLQGADGVLYGTTSSGGTNTTGTIFKLNVDGTGYMVLHVFGAQSDGQYPDGGLVQGPDGTLYGTSYQGGTGGKGTVFQVSTNGINYAILHDFGGTGSGDGQWPFAGLTLGADGWLYGTSYQGGSNNLGTVFKLNRAGTIYGVLHHFSSSSGDGQLPYAGVLQGSDGALYGTTQNGGAGGYGTVYTLGTNGTGFNVRHDFDWALGVGLNPRAGLVQASDGALYGTTPSGPNSKGAVFKLNPDGSGYTVLHSFGSAPADGQTAYAALVQASDGALYGTTTGGGSASAGTAYRLNLDGTGYRVLYSFGIAPNDGQQPQAALIQGRDGALYGTTYLGGDGGSGIVFRLLIAPVFTAISRTADRNVQLSLSGFANVTYRVEASANLSTWVPLGNLTGTGASFSFTDLTATNFPNRFYRAVW